MPEAQAVSLIAQVSSSQGLPAGPQSDSRTRGGFSGTQQHHVSFLLSPAARYQNELAGVDTELLAERFYYQALSVAPQIGKWRPTQASLTGSSFQQEDDIERAGRPHWLHWVLLCSVPSHFALVVHSPSRTQAREKCRFFF